MTLEQFLKQVNWEENTMINYEWEEALMAVKQNWSVLQYVRNQTEEICLEAVKQDWYALQYVRNQTEEICLEAVKQNWYALRYVRNQTEEICIEAVKHNWYALQFVNKNIFTKEIKEYTIEQLQEKLWEEFKIIK
jgi:hypothetical protein